MMLEVTGNRSVPSKENALLPPQQYCMREFELLAFQCPPLDNVSFPIIEAMALCPRLLPVHGLERERHAHFNFITICSKTAVVNYKHSDVL